MKVSLNLALVVWASVGIQFVNGSPSPLISSSGRIKMDSQAISSQSYEEKRPVRSSSFTIPITGIKNTGEADAIPSIQTYPRPESEPLSEGDKTGDSYNVLMKSKNVKLSPLFPTQRPQPNPLPKISPDGRMLLPLENWTKAVFHFNGKNYIVDDDNLSRPVRKSNNISSTNPPNNQTGTNETGPSKTLNTTLSPEELATTIIPIDDEPLFEGPILTTSDSIFKAGPPWKDEKVIGKKMGTSGINRIEISFRVASKLCKAFRHENPDTSGKAKRLHLWAPINQYIPLLHKAYPLRPPLYSPECLKFVLKECRGAVRRPILKPCTYWSPQIIHRPECGYYPDGKTRIVNYRLPHFVPGNCPCTYPCTRRFDPIQRCRVNVTAAFMKEDNLDSEGQPKSGGLEIQENMVAQLCRGLRVARSIDKVMSIGWVPIRVENPDQMDTLLEEFEGPAKPRRKREEQKAPDKHKRKPAPKATQFFSPDDGKVAEGGVLERHLDDERFSRIVVYDPNKGLEGNITWKPKRKDECQVWRYQPCSKNDNGKPIVDYDAIDDNWNGKRAQGQDSNANLCGEWSSSKLLQCIPERLATAPVSPKTQDTSTSGENSGRDLIPPRARDSSDFKRTAVKDLCPGTHSRFPCLLLRKKREDTIVNVVVNNVVESSSKEQEDEPSPIQGRALQQASAEVGPEEASVTDRSSFYYINKIKRKIDPGCRCDWPCLPFFDKINRCYDRDGNVLTDWLGRNIVPMRSFRKLQRDPVICINFADMDEIYCKIKPK